MGMIRNRPQYLYCQKTSKPLGYIMDTLIVYRGYQWLHTHEVFVCVQNLTVALAGYTQE